MRILYVSHGDVPSKWAHSFQAVKMAAALSEQVASLTLLTRGSVLPGPPQRVDLARWYGLRAPLRTVRLPVHWRLREPWLREVACPRFDAAAAWYARLASPDLVYARSPGAAVRCVRLGVPTLVELHGVPKPEGLQREIRDLLAVAERRALRGLVTVTGFLSERYAELGFPRAKLLAAPDAVDLEPFRHAADRRAARRELSLPEDQPLAVYAGHFYPHKGVPCLIEAARLLPELAFCLVGGWPRDIEAMRRQAKDLRNVRFAGFVPNACIPTWLAAADLLVLPNSGAEPHARATSPLKLFEYMAARRAIAASAIPAFDGLLRHGENALLVPPDRPEALAAALGELAGDAARAGRLAEQAWRDVQDFTWERRARCVLERFAAGPA